jgi:uncharacterized protein
VAKFRRDAAEFLAGPRRVCAIACPLRETVQSESVVAAYNCSKCPGYCCSYPVIPLKSRDVTRLARHFGLGFEAARKKFTKVDGDEPFAMRRKADEHFGRICRFFDTDKRSCTIYEARPEICRNYPGSKTCGYYDFLKSERDSLRDPTHIASTWNK